MKSRRRTIKSSLPATLTMARLSTSSEDVAEERGVMGEQLGSVSEATSLRCDRPPTLLTPRRVLNLRTGHQSIVNNPD